MKKILLVLILLCCSVVYLPAQMSLPGWSPCPSGVVQATNAGFVPITTGLVYWARMQEGSGTTVSDSSSSANTGTLVGSSWVSGPPGSPVSPYALSFGGGLDKVTTTQNSPLTVNAFTVCCWFNPGVTTRSDIVSIWNSGADPSQFDLINGLSSGKTRIYAIIPAAVNTPDTTATLSIGTWYFLAATWDGTTLSMYVNGVLDQSTTAPGPLRASGAQPVYIGNNSNGDGATTGIVGDVRLYTRALSGTEILSIDTFKG